MRQIRCLLVATHPIQYHAPWFRELARRPRISLKVLFLRNLDAQQQGAGFGQAFAWDIPMLEGYKSDFLFSMGSTPSWRYELLAIVRHVRREKPDVVLLTGWNSRGLLVAMAVTTLLRIPTVVRGDSNALRPRRLWQKVLHKLLLPLYNAYVAVGESNKEFYRQYGVAPSRIYYGRHVVDNERFIAQRERLLPQRKEVRQGWGCEHENEVCFLFAGKMEEKKQPLLLLQAIKRLAKAGIRVRGLMVGDGDLREEMEVYVSHNRLPVAFTGFLNQSEIAKAYVAADVLVLPSDYGETWGLVVNEAMLFDRPAIVSDRVGCGPDLVEDGVTGFRFPFGDVEALALCMKRLLQDHSLRLNVGLAAGRRVREHYTVEKAVDGTVAALLAASGRVSFE